MFICEAISDASPYFLPVISGTAIDYSEPISAPRKSYHEVQKAINTLLTTVRIVQYNEAMAIIDRLELEYEQHAKALEFEAEYDAWLDAELEDEDYDEHCMVDEPDCGDCGGCGICMPDQYFMPDDSDDMRFI